MEKVLYPATKFFDKRMGDYVGIVEYSLRKVFDVTDQTFMKDCFNEAEKVIKDTFKKTMNKGVNRFREELKKCET